ncbi:MAG: sugar ABC transporter substrate-binding protein [Bacillota bacterium]|nr:sugar ABC transporter substrate-binding protein [Bacillota bacterium]
MKRYKIFNLALSTLLCVSLLGGCGSQKKENIKQITIRIGMESQPVVEQKTIENLIEDYAKSHPGLKIEVQDVAYNYYGDLNKKLQDKNLPDVFMIYNETVPSFARAGAVCPLDEYVSQQELKDYNENLLNQFKGEGKLYGLPVAGDTMALYYNKDMFGKEGLQPPTNWQELKDDARRLTKGDVMGIASGFNPYEFIPYMFQAGGKLSDGKNPTFNSDECVKGMEYFLSLITDESKDGGRLNISSNPRDDFMNQKVAMFVGFSVDFRYFEQKKMNINWGVVPLPKGDFEGGFFSTVGVAVSSYSENRSEAIELAKFLAGEKIQNLVTNSSLGLPAGKLMQLQYENMHPNMEAFIKMMNVSNPLYSGNDFDLVFQALSEAGKRISSGEITNAKEALDYGMKVYNGSK